MPEVTFTQEDLLAGQPLEAKWYKLKILEVDEKPGVNDPKSTTWPTKFVVDEQGPFKGVPVMNFFSEKVMWRLAAFLRCFTGGKLEAGKAYSIQDTVGKLVMGYCFFDPERGWNAIKDFRPVGR